MSRFRIFLLWAALIALGITAYCAADRLRNREEDVSASSFVGMIESGDIVKVTFSGHEIVGERSGGRGKVKTHLQEQSHVIAMLEANDIPYSDTPPPNYVLWVGAGIVHDSVPKTEFEETEHKGNSCLRAIREAQADSAACRSEQKG